jgi:UDP-N-acetylmuramyl pentapeptide phosphotransferase/UDP-N-acetylglucosamine-1-phosphate transferase
VLIGALLGFLVWNYPAGFLFAGDGGAYLVGFLVALLSVLLVMRNPDVSAWFPLLLTAYPVWETLFSIYRKKFLRGQSPNQPDGVHLHMLIYKRLVRCCPGSRAPKDTLRRNALTSPYLWAMTALSAVPAVIFWNDTPALMGFAALFVAMYCRLYWRIVRFRAPKWMILRKA